jgi:hypothetical protein
MKSLKIGSLSRVLRARSFLPVAGVLFGALQVGCVSETRFEEVRSAAQVEQEARRRATAELERTKQENRELLTKLETKEKAAAIAEKQIDEAKLGLTVATKERESAAELVTQLRGELARVGEHLRTFTDEKRQLGLALENAEARARELSDVDRRATDLALVIRDTALLLPEPIAAGEVELTIKEGRAQVRMPGSRAFLPDGRTLTPEANELVSALVKLGTLHSRAAFEATEVGGTSSDGAERMLRLRTLGEAFSAAGLPAQRLVIRVPEAAQPPSAPPSDASETAAPAEATAAPEAKPAPVIPVIPDLVIAISP